MGRKLHYYITLLVVLLISGCGKEDLPEVYGIFIQDRGKLTRLELNMPEEKRRNFSKNATIIILDKRLGSGFVNPDEMVRILNRKYVRYNVETVLEHKDAPPKEINITPADYFGAFGESFRIMIGPIKNQNEMLRIKPKEQFAPGMYYLEFLEDRYPFAIELGGMPEKNNPLNDSLDKYITTVGNTILNIDYKTSAVLDEDFKKWKRDALTAITSEDWRKALTLTRKVQAYDPKERELSKLLFNKLIDSAKKAKSEKRWDNALEQGKLALIIKPNDTEMLQLVNDVPFLKASSEAKFAFEQKRWDDALQQVQKALSIKPDNAEMAELRKDVLYEMEYFAAQKALELHEYDKALDNIEEALKIKPENDEADTVYRMIWRGIREDPKYFGRFFKVIKTLYGHKDDVVSVGFYSNGKYLASGSEDGSIKLWNMRTGKEIKTLAYLPERVIDISLSSDGKFLASESYKAMGGTVQVWNTQTGEQQLKIESQGWLQGYAFSPDGTSLLVPVSEVEYNREVIPYKPHNYSIIKIVDIQQRSNSNQFSTNIEINSIAYSPDGQFVALGSNREGTVTIYDKQLNNALRKISVFDNPSNTTKILSITFKKDNQQLALVTKSFFTEKISIYDAKTGNKINAFSGDLPFALNPGWEILAMGEKSFTSNGKIELINIHTNKVIRRLECESDAKSLTFSPDGKYLVSGCRNGKIYVWGVVTSYEENRNHFEANKNAFNGEKVRASHILIDTRNMKTEEELEEAKKMIDEVKAMIDKGADFAEMAKKYSNCPSAGKGGDIGLFQRKDDKVVEEFAKVAFSMDVGDISEPIKTHFGYHIIKVTDKQEGKDVTYSDVTDTDNSNLILGSWKSEYSKTEYFRDGTFISNADTGKRYTGTWSIEGNILRLQFINPLRKLQIYTIIEMTDSTYKIKLNHADKHTSNARRVEPIKQSPDYTTEKSIIHLSNPRVRMETNYGVITLKLDSPAAPKTVENFLQYTQDGYYDGTIFHRVINEFMIQGGGINANMQEKPARNPIINEADNGLRNLRGTVAMARSNDPHSASSQFFINTANNISLDYKGKNAKGWGYCVFGKVVDGMDVVNTIENLPTITKGKYHDVPASPVIIESVIVENDSQQFNAATSGNNEKSYVYNKVSSSVFSAHNSRVYHKRNCSELNTDDLIEFASSQKADDAGGVPCKNCNPSVVVEGNTRQQDKPGKSRTTYEWTGWKSLFKSKD